MYNAVEQAEEAVGCVGAVVVQIECIIVENVRVNHGLSQAGTHAVP